MPSQDPLDTVKAWIALRDDKEVINASRLDIEEEFVGLCTRGGTGDGAVGNEGGGRSSEVKSEVELTGVSKYNDSTVRCVPRRRRKQTKRTISALWRKQPRSVHG